MVSERWEVEVMVDGFGPKHALWRRFIRHAEALADTSLEWQMAQPEDPAGRTAHIRAVLEAESPGIAVRRVMKLVRQAGDSVDRGEQVPWATMTATARRTFASESK
jgi:hypothetical protein